MNDTTEALQAPRPEIDDISFDREVHAFLAAHATLRSDPSTGWGHGSDDVGFFRELTRDEELAELQLAREWRAAMFDNGLGWLSGPARFGGRELPDRFERRYRELEGDYDIPDQVCFSLGLGMVSPTIIAHGSDTTKDRYLAAIHRGDVLACQLFSEPGAGSDLASLTTRATRDGDGWRLNGQKVWTSRAHVADIGLCLARTGDADSRHRGLTCFVVDMRAAGVDVRPLRQMTGGSTFNEVFLQDAWVADDHRIGAVDGGWDAAITTLMNERQRIGGGGGGVPELDLPRLLALMDHCGRRSDPVIRQRAASLVAKDRTATWTAQRGQANAQRTGVPGPEMSAAKLLRTSTASDLSDLVASVLGAAITADTGEWGTFAWSQLLLGQPGVRIGGGTDEILRNVLGERVLGLPR